MPNSRDTFVDWNHCQSGIAVLPVGACEQHSHHLPLATDALLAEYFANFVGEQLNAAVLPPLTFGTSYEHSGFRGTFSLRPETAMALIRDVAADAEQQNFHTLIIVNFHGGNFFLTPVIRDINRHHPKIKLLLVFPPEFSPSPVLELHSGEWETSIMLHLFPQLVRPVQPNEMHADWTEQRFRQPDLNHWGLGRISPSGALGHPEKASAEKGAKIVAEIKDGLIKWIKQYTEWREKYPRYADYGGITYRELVKNDIDAAMTLTVGAGWNQTVADWRNFIEFNPHGCIAAVRQGRVIGTATTIAYEQKIGWIGMVLVDAQYRRQGIGRQLLLKSLDTLTECQCVKLDATPLGEPLYRSLGFEAEYTLTRMVREPNGAAIKITMPTSVRQMEKSDLEHVIKYDQAVFGAPRSQIINAWFRGAPQYAWICETTTGISGYCLGRRGRNFDQLGPLIADEPATAQELLTAVLSSIGMRALILDAPHREHSDWSAFLESAKFSEQRQLLRMYRGVNAFPGLPQKIWSICAPEVG